MRAFSTLIGIIFFLSFTSVVTLGMTLISISGLKSNFYITQSRVIEQYSETCVDEVLRKLRDDLNYIGGTIPLNETINCTSQVSGNDTQKTIMTTVADGDFQRGATVSIDVISVGEAHNFRITNWIDS